MLAARANPDFSIGTRMSPFKRFLGARFFPALLVAFGALGLWAGIDNMVKGWASLDWPSTDGVITSSEFGQNDNSAISSANKKSSATTYYAKVEYEYAVEGLTYAGNKVSYGETASVDREEAERVLKPYPEGQTVRVYYNPDSHRQGLLEPGLHGYPWLFLLPGVLFLGAGILMARHFPKNSA